MFSAKGTYPAVGLFSIPHIVSIAICFLLVFLLVVFSREMSKERFIKYLRLITVVTTILEVFKTLWTLSHGYTNVDSWVPLYFCSGFTFALWMTWSSKDLVRDIGFAYIVFGCTVAGIAFIIFPTTSFTSYPIFHFKCIYSMLYHSAMVYVSIMAFITKISKINLKLVAKYILFCLVFEALGLIVNWLFGGNMMFLSNPNNIPIEALHIIYGISPALYTGVVAIAHMLLGPVIYLIYKLVSKLLPNKSKKIVSCIDVDTDEIGEREI